MSYAEDLEAFFDRFDFDEKPMTDDEINHLEEAFLAGWRAREKIIPKPVKPGSNQRRPKKSAAYQPESIESLKKKGYGL